MSEVNTAPPYADAWHYPAVLKRRWTVIATAALVGLLCAYLFLVLSRPTYTATTSVGINAITSAPFNPTRPDSGLLDAQTEQQLVKSSYVTKQVSDVLDGAMSPQQVRENVIGELPTGGTVMQISFAADSATRARVGATTAGREYLTFRSSLAQERQTAVADNLRAQQAPLQDQLASANAVIFSSTPKSTARVRAVSDRQSITISLGAISSQLNALSSIDTRGGTMLTDAGTLPVSVSPSRYLVFATGLLAGLALGLVGAFVADRLARRVRDERDVRMAGAGGVLASFSARKAQIPPEGPDIGGFRTLRERVLSLPGVSGGVVTVLDRTTGGLESDVPVNLALSLSGRGMRVSLMVVGYSPEFTQVLIGHLGLVESTRDYSWGGEHDESQKHPALTVHHLSHTAQSMDEDLVRGLRARGDNNSGQHVMVVAVGRSADHGTHLTAARNADAVVLVADDRLSRTDLSDLASQLGAAGAAPGGVVTVARKRDIEHSGTSDHVAAPTRVGI